MSDNPLCLLDNVRHSNGSEGLRTFYRDLLKKDREKALELINDPALKFCSLYHLRHICSMSSATEELNGLYRKALKLAAELSGSVTRHSEARMRSDGEDTYRALRWMLNTGFDDDEPDFIYDRIMERSAALLTKSFKDRDVLPEIAEMIFRRNRGGKLIHEFVWAFFEACRPESLALIAQRLTSIDSRDTALAKRLLCFIPCISENDSLPGNMLYNRVMAWLQENVPFLRYTGESLHLSGQPISYEVALDSKYLCRPVSADNGELLSILNPFEIDLLRSFKELPENSRKLMADFSYMLYRTNFSQWTDWIQLPLAGQTGMAERYMGGLA